MNAATRGFSAAQQKKVAAALESEARAVYK